MVSLSIKRDTNNKFLLLVLVICLLFGLTSCKKKEEQDLDTSSHSDFPLEYKGFLKNKEIYFTSIGQSYEYNSFIDNIIGKYFQFDYTADNLLESTTVSEGSVVVLFIGGSIKTLSALDLTVESEINRINEFVNLHNDGKIDLVCIHLGGERRRGITSDALLEIGFANSDLNIFVEEGNFDYLLSTLSTTNNIKCHSIERISEMKSEMILLLDYNDIQ